MARRIKVKIPKRVAGVKIPKQLRKGGLNSFLNSSAGQIVIAEALVLLAGALGVAKADPRTSTGDSSRLSYAFARAAAAFRDAMHEGVPGTDMSASDRSSAAHDEDDLELPARRDGDTEESAAVMTAEESRGKKKRQTSQSAATGGTAASGDILSRIPH